MDKVFAKKALKKARGSENEQFEFAVKRKKGLSALGEKEKYEELLENLVFGAEDELVERLNAEHEHSAYGNLLEEDSSDLESEAEVGLKVSHAKKAVWEDEDDGLDEAEGEILLNHRGFVKGENEKSLSKERLQKRLKEQFRRAMGGTPLWAEESLKKSKGSTNTGDEDESLFCSTGNFLTKSESLPKGIIQMKSCLNANNDRPSEAKLSTVQFHPSAQVVMTAGFDQSISLFQVDGKSNLKIQSIFLEKFPVFRARFSADGEQLVATGNHNKLFYIYDMMEGKIVPIKAIRGLDEKKVGEFEVSPDGMFLLIIGASGYLHLLTMKTKELICSMKIDGKVTGAAFSLDGSKIYTCSDEGEVFIWDVKSRKCLNRLTDDGSLKGTSIAVSRSGQYLACGSQSGVVNIYSHDACLKESTPKPLKAVMNLLTPVTSLCFNPTSEILGIASNTVDEAIRLVHIPSFTAFSNYPVFRRKTVHLPQCMDFSPNSGFFSVANDKGKALLYRLKHYKDF
ncbi:U3 small nucleolar RNA-associated protein 18 homolog [Scleropages formosus]|uniref:U3 small nucleolar RNA-associated protein 18 homolog n=1 Tax=Scleropages formosus TaxID=113540 RepID=A0A8C9SBH8_SCLFO|nr:U3 small nucleolar RNA-associated protein 18 homolog [Scleropages formosus]